MRTCYEINVERDISLPKHRECKGSPAPDDKSSALDSSSHWLSAGINPTYLLSRDLITTEGSPILLCETFAG